MSLVRAPGKPTATPPWLGTTFEKKSQRLRCRRRPTYSLSELQHLKTATEVPAYIKENALEIGQLAKQLDYRQNDPTADSE
jgi:hypothetical protein